MDVFENLFHYFDGQHLKDTLMKLFHQPTTPQDITSMKKILFILKHRDNPYCSYSSGGAGSGLSSGLLNSATMVSDMLNDLGLNGHECESKIVQVIDNNCIDKEVFKFKPDIVIIEAIWVVPEKFEVLTKLHPHVKWIIRNHSNIPFLAQEGQALGWLPKYTKFEKVFIASNTHTSVNDLKALVSQTGIPTDKVVYFPNYYSTEVESTWQDREVDPSCIHVGCFGAIRPLKNQLQQAFAALRYAEGHRKHLYFHINTSRLESGGNPILHNIRNIFAGSPIATLVEHQWLDHDDFVELIATMDINLQVSYSETFNIVSADAVAQGVPVVVSEEIFWVSKRYHANPNSPEDIIEKMEMALEDSVHGRHQINMKLLQQYNDASHTAISNAIIKVFHS